MLPAPFTSDFLSRLEALRLRTRKEFLGSRPGSYSSPRRGTSLEFADYRRYSPGDDLRYLDWGIFARSDRLYIKLFREEVELFAYFFIDASGSMAFPSVKEKFSPACHIALALSYVVLANHDHVKLHLLRPGTDGASSPFYRGRHRIKDLIGFVSSMAPSGPLEMAPALGEPVLSVRPLKVAIVLDNSASMAALEGEKSRFALAQDQARSLLGDLSAGAQVDLYLTTPGLERVGDKAVAPATVAALISALKPYDLGERAVDYGEELSRLLKEKGYERLFLLTDHPARGSSGAIKVITVGRPRDNLAVTSFRINGPSFAAEQREARVEITSFSAKEEKVKLLLKGSGKPLASRALTIGPRKRVEATFQGFPAYSAYEAEIEQGDALALDNHRFAVAPPSGELDILAISPRAQELYSLRSIPGLRLKVVSPEAYGESKRQDHAVEIFHFSAPALLPQKHALFVLPPKENPMVAVDKVLSQPVVSGWADPHPLTRYVNFALFRPSYARTMKPLSFGEALIESPQGAIAIGLEHQGFRYLALGFDPFPYLGRDNLPMSIFTLNLLSWFYEGLGGGDIATGEPLDLKAPQGGTLVSPKGEKFTIREGEAPFSQTYFQGLYELTRGQEKELFALNLKDVKESDLASPTPIELKEEPAVLAGRSFLFSLWPYFLLLSLLLLFLEWFFNPPVTQP